MNLFNELRRRNVAKVALAYVVICWLLIELASLLFGMADAPPSLLQGLVVLVLIGFPAALVIAWRFEMTPAGLKRTENLSPNETIPYWSRRKFAGLIGSMALVALALMIFRCSRSQHRSSAAGHARQSLTAVISAVG